ncbi:MAG TPA: slipin family protein [Candidatus Aveggerthella stercoripullorum]|uniref:Slipin family protein n=1 Tax=Candidatus Aveggerthella stercoripullorum TaxID=2840688 RepID=A0A9D1D3V2_9ACTN|nr:slipin family protein [Candidatus Aveggerthella stercoripullorum]
MTERKRIAKKTHVDRGAETGTDRVIETYNSPRVRRTDSNAGSVFSAFIFVGVALAAGVLGYAATGEVNIWTIVAAFALAVFAASTVRIAAQWERAVILRFGAFDRVAGPGLYLMIPFVEHVALHADQRIMLTGFDAEETLTADLVPVNVDAAVFWMIWDAEKACLEVEDYYDAVSMAAQTALRDAIGRKDLSDVTVHRDKLDQELRDKIEEKTNPWGISVLSVEIRDIVIPKELQRDMAAAAKAEREKDARIVLAEVEKDVAAMLLEATEIYRKDEMAFELRSMHLLSEGVKESNGTLVIPSAYSEGFKSGKGQPSNDAHSS